MTSACVRPIGADRASFSAVPVPGDAMHLGFDKPLSRLLNSAWMIAGWFLRTLRLGRFDAIIVGSDPA